MSEPLKNSGYAPLKCNVYAPLTEHDRNRLKFLEHEQSLARLEDSANAPLVYGGHRRLNDDDRRSLRKMRQIFGDPLSPEEEKLYRSEKLSRKIIRYPVK